MKPPPIRHRRAVLTVVGAAAVVVVALLWKYSPHRSPDEPAIAVAVPSAATAAQGFPPATLDPRPDLSASPDHIEICGIGWVKAKPLEDPLPKAVYAAADAALDDAASAMIRSGSGAERAAAMSIQRGTAWYRTAEEHRRANPGCDQDPACTAAGDRLARDASLRAAQALAQEGLATLDPKVYAVCYYACDRGVEGSVRDGDCARYSAARWAQLEPGNAIPWLFLAAAAQTRKDEAARDEALRRASQAAYADYHNRSMFALLAHPAVRGKDAGTRLAAMTRLSGIWAAFAIPNLSVIGQSCSEAAMRDSERRQMCSSLGRVFTDNGSDLLLFSLGIRLGTRAGWPEQQLAPLRDRLDAAQQVTIVLPDNLWSCESMRRAEAHLEGLLRGGELANADRLIAETGRPAADLAREWRARRPNPRL